MIPRTIEIVAATRRIIKILSLKASKIISKMLLILGILFMLFPYLHNNNLIRYMAR
jgi:hypothetical protein